MKRSRACKITDVAKSAASSASRPRSREIAAVHATTAISAAYSSSGLATPINNRHTMASAAITAIAILLRSTPNNASSSVATASQFTTWRSQWTASPLSNRWHRLQRLQMHPKRSKVGKHPIPQPKPDKQERIRAPIRFPNQREIPRSRIQAGRQPHQRADGIEYKSAMLGARPASRIA